MHDGSILICSNFTKIILSAKTFNSIASRTLTCKSFANNTWMWCIREFCLIVVYLPCSFLYIFVFLLLFIYHCNYKGLGQELAIVHARSALQICLLMLWRAGMPLWIIFCQSPDDLINLCPLNGWSCHHKIFLRCLSNWTGLKHVCGSMIQILNPPLRYNGLNVLNFLITFPDNCRVASFIVNPICAIVVKYTK